MTERVRLAIQRSGRLARKSMALLHDLGAEPFVTTARLIEPLGGLPIDLLLVRDDDIPEYVARGACELGIVGLNVVENRCHDASVVVLARLGYGRCRLSIAIPEGVRYGGLRDLDGCRVATAYPGCLMRYAQARGITVQVVPLHGSVEVAPALGMADAVCEIVSTGATLRAHGLVEVEVLLESEAVLIGSGAVHSCRRDRIIKDLARCLGDAAPAHGTQDRLRAVGA